MYKISKYNYFVEDSERVIYFNGLSNHVFSLDRKEHTKMQLLFEDLISFEINYNSVFSQFVKWGFIIDEDVDEIDIICYRNRIETVESKSYRVIINPTLECNFNCWYCYEEHPKGFMNQETIEKIKNHIKYKVEEERITALTQLPLLPSDSVNF